MFDIDITKEMKSREGKTFHLETSFQTTDRNVVLFGPSGSGKSLTLRSIAGLLTPDKGHIRIGERTLFDVRAKINLPARKRRVSIIFQDYALFPHMNIYNNVAFGLKKFLRPLSAEEHKRVEALLELFELSHLRNSRPSEISGGQQQRVALARGLAVNPDLLLLDEPFSALDKPLRKRMYQELTDILHNFSMPLVLVTHDPEEMDFFAETVVTFSGGQTSVRMKKETAKKTSETAPPGPTQANTP